MPLATSLIGLCIAATWYEGPVENWLRRFKYPGRSLLSLEAGPFSVVAELITSAAAEHAAATRGSVDAVIAVPSPPERIRARTFHPAGALAQIVGASIDRPVVHGALVSTGTRASQTGLSRNARRHNVMGAFCAGATRVRDTRLLLVDDVVTTGATLESAARVLRDAGATRVDAVCAVRARLHDRLDGHTRA